MSRTAEIVCVRRHFILKELPSHFELKKEITSGTSNQNETDEDLFTLRISRITQPRNTTLDRLGLGTDKTFFSAKGNVEGVDKTLFADLSRIRVDDSVRDCLRRLIRRRPGSSSQNRTWLTSFKEEMNEAIEQLMEDYFSEEGNEQELQTEIVPTVIRQRVTVNRTNNRSRRREETPSTLREGVGEVPDDDDDVENNARRRRTDGPIIVEPNFRMRFGEEEKMIFPQDANNIQDESVFMSNFSSDILLDLIGVSEDVNSRQLVQSFVEYVSKELKIKATRKLVLQTQKVSIGMTLPSQILGWTLRFTLVFSFLLEGPCIIAFIDEMTPEEKEDFLGCADLVDQVRFLFNCLSHGRLGAAAGQHRIAGRKLYLESLSENEKRAVVQEDPRIERVTCLWLLGAPREIVQKISMHHNKISECLIVSVLYKLRFSKDLWTQYDSKTLKERHGVDTLTKLYIYTLNLLPGIDYKQGNRQKTAYIRQYFDIVKFPGAYEIVFRFLFMFNSRSVVDQKEVDSVSVFSKLLIPHHFPTREKGLEFLKEVTTELLDLQDTGDPIPNVSQIIRSLFLKKQGVEKITYLCRQFFLLKQIEMSVEELNTFLSGNNRAQTLVDSLKDRNLLKKIYKLKFYSTDSVGNNQTQVLLSKERPSPRLEVSACKYPQILENILEELVALKRDESRISQLLQIDHVVHSVGGRSSPLKIRWIKGNVFDLGAILRKDPRSGNYLKTDFVFMDFDFEFEYKRCILSILDLCNQEERPIFVVFCADHQISMVKEGLSSYSTVCTVVWIKPNKNVNSGGTKIVNVTEFIVVGYPKVDKVMWKAEDENNLSKTNLIVAKTLLPKERFIVDGTRYRDQKPCNVYGSILEKLTVSGKTDHCLLSLGSGTNPEIDFVLKSKRFSLVDFVDNSHPMLLLGIQKYYECTCDNDNPVDTQFRNLVSIHNVGNIQDEKDSNLFLSLKTRIESCSYMEERLESSLDLIIPQIENLRFQENKDFLTQLAQEVKDKGPVECDISDLEQMAFDAQFSLGGFTGTQSGGITVNVPVSVGRSGGNVRMNVLPVTGGDGTTNGGGTTNQDFDPIIEE